MSKLWNRLKALFQRRKSEWVHKKITVTYWTKRANEAIIDYDALALKFKSKDPANPTYYIDTLVVKEN